MSTESKETLPLLTPENVSEYFPGRSFEELLLTYADVDQRQSLLKELMLNPNVSGKFDSTEKLDRCLADTLTHARAKDGFLKKEKKEGFLKRAWNFLWGNKGKILLAAAAGFLFYQYAWPHLRAQFLAEAHERGRHGVEDQKAESIKANLEQGRAPEKVPQAGASGTAEQRDISPKSDNSNQIIDINKNPVIQKKFTPPNE